MVALDGISVDLLDTIGHELLHLADDDWGHTFDQLLHPIQRLRLLCLLQTLQLRNELLERILFLIMIFDYCSASVYCAGHQFGRVTWQQHLTWRSSASSLVIKEEHLLLLEMQLLLPDILLLELVDCLIERFH